MDEKQIERFLDGLAKIQGIDKNSDKYKELVKESKKLAEGLKNSTNTLRDWRDDLVQAGKNLNVMKSKLKEGKITQDEYNKAQQALRQETGKYAEAVRETAKANEDLKNAFKSAGADVKTTFAGTKAFAESLHSSSSSLPNVGGMMNGAATAAAGSMNLVGNAAMMAGSALAAMPNPITVAIGGLLAFGGAAFKAIGAAGQAAVSTFAGLIQPELERVITGFRDLSRVGGVFMGGMNDFRKIALDAGLTVDQFAKGFIDSLETMQLSGMNMAEAARSVSAVMASSGEEFKKRLLSLGYDIEEMPYLFGQVLADMRYAGEKFVNSPEQNAKIQQSTMEYAKNLRMIADLTGKDAKQQLEEARKRSMQTLIASRLMAMDPEAQKRYNLMRGNLTTEAEKEAFDARIARIPLASAAVLESLSPAIREHMDNISDYVLKGGRDASEVMKDRRTAEFGDKFVEEIRTQLGPTIGALDFTGTGSGDVGKVAANLNELFERAQRTGAKKAEQGDDERTGNVNVQEGMHNALLDLMVTMQEFKVLVQERILTEEIISTFAQTTNWIAEQMISAIEKLIDTIQDLLGKDSDAGKSRNSGPETNSGGTYDPNNPMYDPNIPTPLGSQEFASGGIVDYPDSGRTAILHGREAIIPLGDSDKLVIDVPKVDVVDTKLTLLTSSIDRMLQKNGTQMEEFNQNMTMNLETLKKIQAIMEQTLTVNKSIAANVR